MLEDLRKRATEFEQLRTDYASLREFLESFLDPDGRKEFKRGFLQKALATDPPYEWRRQIKGEDRIQVEIYTNRGDWLDYTGAEYRDTPESVLSRSPIHIDITAGELTSQMTLPTLRDLNWQARNRKTGNEQVRNLVETMREIRELIEAKPQGAG